MIIENYSVMAEEVVQQPKKKKSKVGKFFLTLFILFLIFIVGPIALFYGFFFDPMTKKVNVEEDATVLSIGNRLIVDSLDYAPTEQQIAIKVSENDIDNLLHIGMKTVTEKVKYLKKAYMKKKGSTYKFYLDIDGVIIKTRLIITTELKISEDKENFVFRVKDVALGRLGGILTPAKFFANKFITDEKIDQFIAGTGLDITFKREDYSISYPKTSILKDLSKLANVQDLGLYFDVMQTMLTDNLLDFKFDTESAIEGIIDLTKLQTNELVTDDEQHIKVQSEDVQELRDKLAILIEHGDINPDEKLQPFYAFEYLFSGWEQLSDEGKASLASVNFSYVDIDDKEAYKGFDLAHQEAKLFERMKDTVNAHDLIDKDLNPRYTELCSISEQDINDFIAGRNVVGHSSLLHRNSPEGYKVNYITVENFYMNIYKNSLNKNIAEMVCKIDVNGYLTSLTFETEMPDGGFSDNKLTFAIKDIRFGQTDADNLKEQFFNIIADALNNSGDESLIADAENYTISVDFSDIMEYARAQIEEMIEQRTGTHYDLESYFTMSNMTFEITGSSREDNGTMKLSLIEPIDY